MTPKPDVLRIADPKFAAALGPDFALAISGDQLGAFLEGLRRLIADPPSTEMAAEARMLFDKCEHAKVATVRFRRAIGTSGKLPRVVGCDVLAILTVLAAFIFGNPTSLVGICGQFLASGIPLKTKRNTDSVEIELFGETLTIGRIQ